MFNKKFDIYYNKNIQFYINYINYINLYKFIKKNNIKIIKVKKF